MSDSDLISDLTAIVAETSKERKATGSLRDGTLRGVGYSSAQGYIDALARGVKQSTADEYKRILRGTYGMISAVVDAFPCAVMDEFGRVASKVQDPDPVATSEPSLTGEPIEFHTLLELD